VPGGLHGLSAEAYQRPREKNPSSSSTSTTIRMIQRIDTEESPLRSIVVGDQTADGDERLRPA
jgi:hypothetical protein